MVITVLKSIREGVQTREFGWLALAMAAGILAAVGAGQISGQGYVGGGFADMARNSPGISAPSSTAAGSGTSHEYSFDFFPTVKGVPEPAAVILAGAGIGLGFLLRRANSRRRERAIRWENSCRARISTTAIRGNGAGASPEAFGHRLSSQPRS